MGETWGKLCIPYCLVVQPLDTNAEDVRGRKSMVAEAKVAGNNGGKERSAIIRKQEVPRMRLHHTCIS